MRVLFVTTRFPAPFPHGDQARAYAQIAHLSPRHAITLLTLADAVDPEHRRVVESRCERVVVVRDGWPRRALRALRALPGDVPLQVAMHASPALADAARALAAAQRCDLAHLQLVRLGELAEALAPLPCVVDFVDALSVNMARRATLDRSLAAPLAALEARRLAAYERALVARVAGAALASAPDRDAIGGALGCVDNGVEPERFPFVAGGERAPEVVFVGHLGYFPNVGRRVWHGQGSQRPPKGCAACAK